MEWLNKLLGIKDRGKFECVFVKRGEWKIRIEGKDSYDEHCEFQIHHNRVTNEYKLETLGYKATSHKLYEDMFKMYRSLQEGETYYRCGEIHEYTNETIHKRPKQ